MLNFSLRKLCLALILSVSLSQVAFAGSEVNINTADAKTIAIALDGVGKNKAEAIVRYRKANGAFSSLEEVGNVKGIGSKTLAKNKDYIRFK